MKYLPFVLATSLLAAPSIASAQTASLCGTSVDYKLAPPAAGAPPSSANLLGVWVGDWSGLLCSALVVESVNAAGDVEAWYVWGQYSQWNISQPGKAHWHGKLSGNNVEFKD